MAVTRESVAAAIAPAVQVAGLDLEDVTVTTAGRRRLVRVMIDRDGGVTLDDIAEVSRAISAALDAAGVLGETPYLLEVTSPGVDRPLTQVRHWLRNIGRLVRVQQTGEGSVIGRIGSVDEDAVVLDVDGTQQRIDFARIEHAIVEIEFNRPVGDAEGDESGTDEDLGAPPVAGTNGSATRTDRG